MSAVKAATLIPVWSSVNPALKGLTNPTPAVWTACHAQMGHLLSRVVQSHLLSVQVSMVESLDPLYMYMSLSKTAPYIEAMKRSNGRLLLMLKNVRDLSGFHKELRLVLSRVRMS